MMASQQQGKCADWHAWYAGSSGKLTLNVSGKCQFPTPGFKVTLKRQEPQGINPRILLLEKTVQPPSGVVPQVITVERVRYSEPATSTQFNQVTILPDGVTVPVEEPSAVLPAPMFGHWKHSREEDSGKVEIYRPEGFSFPPSFGRDGFEMKKDGGFIQDDLGPADGIVQVRGRWELRDTDQVVVSFKNTDREGYTFTIVEVDEKKLTIARQAIERPNEYGERPA
jgi:hypothetical protein